MLRRRRFVQLTIGAIVFLGYIQFQLFTSTERRLFLKKVKLAVQRGSTAQKLDKICSQSPTTVPVSNSSKGLTLMTWRSKHLKDLRSFIDYPQFPRYPATVQFEMKSSIRLPLSSSTGGWLLGTVLAPESGDYRFAISSSGEAQLRLSRDDEPENSRLIVSTTSSSSEHRLTSRQHNKYSSTSLSWYLYKCQSYFIEVLFHNDQKNGHVEMAWETPSSLRYEIIPIFFLSPYLVDQDFAFSGENLMIFEDTVKLSSLFWHLVREKRSIEREFMDNWSRLPFMNSKDAIRVLPNCSPNLNGRSPGLNLHVPKVNSDSALRLVNGYIQQLVKANKGKYSYRGVHHIEEKTLGNQGKRYLVNLEFKDNIMDVRLRVSEYLFYENEKRELCVMNEFKWRRDAMVTIVAVIREIGSWSHYFMDHLSEMTNKLQDARFSVIIVAPKEMEQYCQTLFSQNTLAWHSRLTLLLLSTKRTQRMQDIINMAIALIKVPNTIIFFTDIRVQMPTKILEHVRKRTVEGKTIFIPWPETFDHNFYENATIISPLERTKKEHPPSFCLYASDWKRLNVQKAATKRQSVGFGQDENWWQSVGNGALEIYASKIPKYYYFQRRKCGRRRFVLTLLSYSYLSHENCV